MSVKIENVDCCGLGKHPNVSFTDSMRITYSSLSHTAVPYEMSNIFALLLTSSQAARLVRYALETYIRTQKDHGHEVHIFESNRAHAC